MKQMPYSFHFISWFFVISFSMISCIPLYTIPDPYQVSQYRQEENLYYSPSAPNTPLLSEKNEFSLTTISTANSKFTGGEIQTAFIPGKHLGITGSFSFSDNAANSAGDNFNYYSKYNRFELGAGFITEVSKTWHFETYAGFGSGKILNNHHSGTSNIKLNHFFVQPAFALHNKKETVQLGFVSRFEGVNFKVTDSSFNSDREPFSKNQLTGLYNQPSHIMWQSGIICRFGWKIFQFQGGYSYSTDLTNPDLYRAKDNFSLGILFRFKGREPGTKKN